MNKKYKFKFYGEHRDSLVNEEGTIWLLDLQLTYEGLLLYNVYTQAECDLEKVAESALRFIKGDCKNKWMDEPYKCYYNVVSTYNACHGCGVPQDAIRGFLDVSSDRKSMSCQDCLDKGNGAKLVRKYSEQMSLQRKEYNKMLMKQIDQIEDMKDKIEFWFHNVINNEDYLITESPETQKKYPLMCKYKTPGVPEWAYHLLLCCEDSEKDDLIKEIIKFNAFYVC